MDNNHFKTGTAVIRALVVINFILNIAWLYALDTNRPFAFELIASGLTASLFTTIIFVYDIYNNSIYNKPFWIISMFAFPTIGPMIYLIRRNALLMQ